MTHSNHIHIQPGRSIAFASDFHLGVPSLDSSLEREKKIIRWLESVSPQCDILFLVGDIFDFWFEYKHVIPKGFIRLQGKLAELTDAGKKIYIFSGNHDMWMKDYFTNEMGIEILHQPTVFFFNEEKILIGHGDGLGPGDTGYKLLKKIFRNKFCQWLFKIIHPTIGMTIAHTWSRKSRITNIKRKEEFLGDKEWLWMYCKELEKKEHHDYYIFGHRHLPLDLEVSPTSRYINLGEWVNYSSYALFDGEKITLLTFSE